MAAVRKEASIGASASSVAKGLIVDIDDKAMRLVWSARSERLTHHNASVQVFEDGPGRCRLVWIADVLPHEMGKQVGMMMEAAMPIMEDAGAKLGSLRDRMRR